MIPGWRTGSLLSWRCRLANLAAAPLAGWISLDAAELLAEARRRCGLNDFGAAGFREALDVLVRACEQEAKLSYVGRRLVRGELIHRLENRLRIEADFRRHPEIAELALPEPIFITGLSRSGTTYLHRLLARDARMRSLQTWELHRPSPPPETASYQHDPRREARRRELAWFHSSLYSRRGLEQVLAMHDTRHDSPEECWPLLQNTLRVRTFFLFQHVPSYHAWLQASDQLEAYREYRRQLQLLTWRCAGRFLLLKAPAHLTQLDVILRLFPNARFLWPHRDPQQTVRSGARLAVAVRQLRSDHVDPRALGQIVLRDQATRVRTAMDQRASLDASRFHDIDFRALVRDPLACLRGIYSFLGAPIEPAEQALRTEIVRVQRARQARPAAADPGTGLQHAAIERAFREYRARFLALG